MTTQRRVIAVIGRNGQLAQELSELAWPAGFQPVFLGRGEIDLFHDALITRLGELQPAAIINTAAYTAVDLAESERALARQLNAEAPAHLGRVAAVIGVPLIHVSTDYVFSGDRLVGYREEDLATPRSVYGQTKRAGEIAVLSSGAHGMVVRTAGLFGFHGQNFLKTMLGKAAADKAQTIKVVDDQVTTPTPAPALAITLRQLTLDMIGGRALPPILHLAGQPAASWFDFTGAIFAALAATGKSELPSISPVQTQDVPRPAYRPAFSALDCGLAVHLGYAIPDWRGALQPIITRLTKDKVFT